MNSVVVDDFIDAAVAFFKYQQKCTFSAKITLRHFIDVCLHVDDKSVCTYM